jgi:peptidoglycan/LPS O-acetylase OafA/YrhL
VLSMGEVSLGRHVDYLDGWRGCSIALLLIGHFNLTPLVAGRDFNPAGLAVECFFALSGRLMADILFVRRMPLVRFYVHRVSRIIPALWLFVLSMLIATAFAPRLNVEYYRANLHPELRGDSRLPWDRRFLGFWSFTLYLWQQPFTHYDGYDGYSLPVLVLLLCLVTLVTFHFFEQPARRFIDSNADAFLARRAITSSPRVPDDFSLPEPPTTPSLGRQSSLDPVFHAASHGGQLRIGDVSLKSDLTARRLLK